MRRNNYHRTIYYYELLAKTKGIEQKSVRQQFYRKKLDILEINDIIKYLWL